MGREAAKIQVVSHVAHDVTDQTPSKPHGNLQHSPEHSVRRTDRHSKYVRDRHVLRCEDLYASTVRSQRALALQGDQAIAFWGALENARGVAAVRQWHIIYPSIYPLYVFSTVKLSSR